MVVVVAVEAATVRLLWEVATVVGKRLRTMRTLKNLARKSAAYRP
jgi:hypothetical protein